MIDIKETRNETAITLSLLLLLFMLMLLLLLLLLLLITDKKDLKEFMNKNLCNIKFGIDI